MSRLLAYLNRRPVNVLPRELSAIADVLVARRRARSLEDSEDRREDAGLSRPPKGSIWTLYEESRNSEGGYAVRNGVAIVPITGILWMHSTMLDVTSAPGGTSYQAIIQATRAAVADRDVNAIMFVVDSPGGDAIGMTTAADELRSILRAGGKPSAAFVDVMAASAAYAMASVADSIVIAQDSEAGSIGTYAVMVDSSKAATDAGFKVTLVSSAPPPDGVKGQGSPGVPIADAAYQELQDAVDQLAGQFVALVAANRGVSLGKAQALADGRMYIGARAVEAGIADEIGTLESTIAKLAQGAPGVSVRRPSRASAIPVAAALSAQGRLAAAAPNRLIAARVGGPVSTVRPTTRIAKDATMTTKKTENADTSTGTENDANTGAAAIADESTEQKGGGTTVEDPEQSQDGAASRANGGTGTGRAATDGRGSGRVYTETEVAQRVAVHGRKLDLILQAHGDVKGVKELVSASRLDINTDVTALAERVMQMSIAERPRVNGIDTTVGSSGGDRHRQDMVAAIAVAVRPQLSQTLAAGDDSADRAAQSLGFNSGREALAAVSRISRGSPPTIQGMIYESLVASGAIKPGRYSGEQLFNAMIASRRIGAAHVTGDFPALFQQGVNRVLQASMAAFTPIWSNLCVEGSMNDFRKTDIISVGHLGTLKRVREGQPTPEVTIGERKETAQLDTYAASFVITREMVINDDLSAVTRAVQDMIRRAQLLPDIELIGQLYQPQTSGFGKIMSDGVAFFDTTRGNTGTNTALAYAAIEAAVQGMQPRSINARASDRDFVPFRPSIVAVSTGRRYTALRAIQQPIGITTDGVASIIPNPLQNELRLIDTPHMATTAWLLASSPSETPIGQVSFLGGRRVPSFEEVETGSSRKIAFESIWDFAVTLLNPEAAYANLGA